jgi:hypothetical protein
MAEELKVEEVKEIIITAKMNEKGEINFSIPESPEKALYLLAMLELAVKHQLKLSLQPKQSVLSGKSILNNLGNKIFKR